MVSILASIFFQSSFNNLKQSYTSMMDAICDRLKVAFPSHGATYKWDLSYRSLKLQSLLIFPWIHLFVPGWSLPYQAPCRLEVDNEKLYLFLQEYPCSNCVGTYPTVSRNLFCPWQSGWELSLATSVGNTKVSCIVIDDVEIIPWSIQINNTKNLLCSKPNASWWLLPWTTPTVAENNNEQAKLIGSDKL